MIGIISNEVYVKYTVSIGDEESQNFVSNHGLLNMSNTFPIRSYCRTSATDLIVSASFKKNDYSFFT